MDWDRDVDLIVVGFGASGTSAALTAEALGATVAIVEKQPEDRHTCNLRLSGGIYMCANDLDRAAVYLDSCAGGLIPFEVSRAWAAKALTLREWFCSTAGIRLEYHGGPEHPDFEGSDAVDAYRVVAGAGGAVTPGTGSRFSTPVFRALAARIFASPRIEVVWGSPVRRLLRDGNGRVCGVEVAAGGETLRLRARKGVVLSCGGYEHDEELKQNFLKAYPVWFYCNPSNTGDGVRLAQSVGAGLWHMNQMVGRAVAHFDSPTGVPLTFLVMLDPPGYLITDKHGRRFANEHPQAQMKHVFYNHLVLFDSDAREYPRIPCYWFFDQRRMSARPLTSLTSHIVGAGFYDWSADNSREVAQGWIKRGGSIAEAAAAAGIDDPTAAEAAVAAYNAACASGSDDFGRPPESLLPLDQPPYYCVPLFPGGSNTSGGPRRNENAQILDAFGDPIAGLYGSGGLGQAVGALYPADGSNGSESMCFGQIAAESALSQP